MDVFYKLTQLSLTDEGSEYMKLYPEAPWGCKLPESELEMSGKYEAYLARRVSEGKSAYWSKEVFMERYNTISAHYQFFNDSTRGYLDSKDYFNNLISDPNPELHDWIHEGQFYTHFIVTPKIFGIDVMPKDWEQLYYKMNTNGIIQPVEVFDGFQSIMF